MPKKSHRSSPSATPLRAGYARTELTPPLGVGLADLPLTAFLARRPRIADKIRDPLYARALHLEVGGRALTLVAADILIITGRLHHAVAERAGISPDSLLLSATHTHSGPGGYWDGGRVSVVMGEYRPERFEHLVSRIAEAARMAREGLRPATLHGASTTMAGVSSNRRRLFGPVDPELTLLRFQPDKGSPIDLVSFGTHPVLGTVREPDTVSADFPGELCARLVRRGVRPLFFQGAVGGLSPLFPEFPMRFDEHLDLVAGLLETGVLRAEAALTPLPVPSLEVSLLPCPVGETSCRVFPPAQRLSPLAEAALYPLRRWMAELGEDGRRGEPDAALHWVRLGDVALLGTPCDLGVGVALSMKRLLRDAGVRYPLVGSQCDGYVGYVHLREDYEHAPEPGFRQMALYENAMSFGGWDVGDRYVELLRRAVMPGA